MPKKRLSLHNGPHGLTRKSMRSNLNLRKPSKKKLVPSANLAPNASYSSREYFGQKSGGVGEYKKVIKCYYAVTL